MPVLTIQTSLKKAPSFAPSRRSFLASVTCTAGALALGFRVPFDAAEAATTAPEVTAWIVIEPDDTVRIRMTRAEMGQGSFTAMPMLVAEELECDWARVKPEFVNAEDNLRRNRIFGDMSAGGSRSVRTSHDYLRKAGATARTMLIAAAATRWNVPAGECRAEKSVIHHVSGKTLRYGELAGDAARITPPADVALKDPKTWKLLNTSVKRLDIPAKVRGAAVYGADVSVPNMLHAAVAQAPVFGAKLKSADDGAVLKMRGVTKVVKLDDAVAVVADNWWRAKQALAALPVVWETSENDAQSDATIHAYLQKGVHASDLPAGREDGDTAKSFASAKKIIKAEYHVPFLNHATMEPQNCTAHVTKDKVEVWAPTQNPEETLIHAAKVAGVAQDKVVVHQMLLGCGLGRRGVEQDYTRLAVRVAMQCDAPVKVLWSREEDMQHDCFRPASVAAMRATLDADKMIDALEMHISIPSIAAHYRPERIKGTLDPQTLEGFTEDLAYHAPNYVARSAMRPVHVPVGNFRSVHLSQNGFYKESFIDELSYEAGEDPVSFRRKLLKANPNEGTLRDLAVLDAVAEKSGWNEPRAKGRFMGVACIRSFGSHTAQVAEISFANGAMKLHRVVVAVDPGHVVNRETVAAQLEGSVALALSAVLYGEITIEKGRAAQKNFDDYRLIRIDEMPEVETIIMPSGGFWGGIGEACVPAVAPAICNALFAATGQRIRSLPLKNHDLRVAGGARAASL